jgi:threonyl-tRNA synthetase
MLIIGEKECADGTVAVRARKAGDLGAMSVADFVAKAALEIASKSRD